MSFGVLSAISSAAWLSEHANKHGGQASSRLCPRGRLHIIGSAEILALAWLQYHSTRNWGSRFEHRLACVSSPVTISGSNPVALAALSPNAGSHAELRDALLRSLE